MISPGAALSGQPLRLADFPTILDALDYAAEGQAGLYLHSTKGEVEEVLTYRILRDEALRLAGRLRAAGLRPGERVALVAETDGGFIRAFFACLYAGLAPAPVPLPSAFGGRAAYLEQIRIMIVQSRARAIIGPPELAAWVVEAASGLGLSFAGGLDALPEAAALERVDVSPDDLAYVQFSSGSTRSPKGVAVTHAALMANAAAVARHGLMIREGDRAVSWLPLYHDMGLVGFLLIPLSCQLTVDLLPTRAFARRPLLWLEIIARSRGTIAYSPSFGYALCARRAENATPAGLDLSGWRVAGIGGDMIRPNVLDAFAERFAASGFRREAFVASYGMAEATLGLGMSPIDRGLRTDVVDATRLEQEGVAGPGPGRTRAFALNGPPLHGHAMEIRAEDGAELPERRVGRVFAKGPSLMRGYVEDLAGTRDVLSADGWLDTGDLGYKLDGELVVTGRAKDLVIVNGRNIWPQDLEWSAEAEVEGLRSGDVAVFSIDDGGSERVIALVQARSREPATRDRLQKEVAVHLRARHGIETEVALVPLNSLPHTSSGKLSRSAAKRLYLSGDFNNDHAPHAG